MIQDPNPLAHNAVGAGLRIGARHRVQHHWPDPGQPQFAGQHQSVRTSTRDDHVNIVNHLAQLNRSHIRAIAASQPAASTEAQTGSMTQSRFHETKTTGARRRQLRMMQIIFAGAAAIAMLALFDAARPDTTQSVLASGSVGLVDQAFPQTPPSLVDGGYAADESSDQAQQQAQQEEQQALQQLDEEENEMAEQQFEEGMQQSQMDEQQANDP